MRRAMYVTPEWTWLDDGSHWATPETVLSQGIAGLLTQLARIYADAGAGTVLLNGNAARELGLPATWDELGDAREHPCAVAARAAGWKVSAIGDWTVFHADGRPLIRMCLTPLVDTADCPLWADTPGETLATLALWHALAGTPYHGNPGMASLAILSDLYPRGKGSPTWKPKSAAPYDGIAIEDDYHPDQWRAPVSGKAYAHSLDANRSYIGSAANVHVAKTILRPGPKRFDRREHGKLGGWMLCELPTWNDPRLPDPAGYHPDRDRKIRPLSIPTLVHLDELAEQGLYGEFRIIESYVADGSTILRPWMWRLRDIHAGKDPEGRDLFAGIPADRIARIRACAKQGGRSGLGLTNKPENWLYRPDWWYSVIAMDRCNRWRKIAKTGRLAHMWPAWIDVDEVFYPSDEPDWRKGVPPEKFPDDSTAWPIDGSGLRLGHFKHKRTLKSKPRRRRAA